MDTQFQHRPVLFEQTLGMMAVREGGIYVDATFGRGGHTRGLLDRLGPDGRLIAIDRDPEAVAAARAINDPRFSIDHAPFSELADVLNAHRVVAIDGVLIDLGVSSPQLDDASRGFSFRHDGPLDMRMDPTRGVSARDWLLAADETQIVAALKSHGEERAAASIARAIVARRLEAGENALRGTAELAALVARVVRRRPGAVAPGKDPATRTFQAIRIVVNSELDEVAKVLQVATDRLRPGGRLAVIAFHSLEDRIVKQFLARESGRAGSSTSAGSSAGSSVGLSRRPTKGLLPAGLRGLPPPTGVKLQSAPRLRLLPRILPDAAEAAANPRARSAVLRGAERLQAVA
jgi:16S rRNA (cytosine1402-N4)-methyltransferase